MGTKQHFLQTFSTTFTVVNSHTTHANRILEWAFNLTMSHGQFYDEIRSVRKPANETSMATQKPQHPKFHAYPNAKPRPKHVPPHPSQWITYKYGHIFTKPWAAFSTLLLTSNIHHSSGYLPSHGTRCCTLRGKIEACPSSHRIVTNSLNVLYAQISSNLQNTNFT